MRNFSSLGLLWGLFILWTMVCCGTDNSVEQQGDPQAVSKTLDDPQRLMPQEESSKILISLLTYNVQSRPILDFQRARVHLPMMASRVSGFDVVQLQECFSQCNLFLDRAPQVEKYYFDLYKDWFSLTNSGLATLAYQPMNRIIPYFFDAKAEIPDWVASKGVILTQMTFNGIATDFYSTHMQAGSSVGAQEARTRQMQELVDFVKRYSPPSHQVIISGDFNMGPRREGKLWSDYSPNHYQSQLDMLLRTAIFDDFMASLDLKDVSDQLFGPRYDHIERVLYRSGTQGRLEPTQWEDLSPAFRNDQGQPLSDSMPLSVGFSIESVARN